MELRALFLLPLCFPGVQGQAPEAYRRREGNTLYIQCPYAAWTTGHQEKYWCFSPVNGGCQEVLRVYSYKDTRQSQDGRIKIKDNEANKTVSVTMSGLKAEDSGTYFCAAYNYNSRTHEQLGRISLIVFRELLQWELDTLTVQCPVWSNAWCQAGSKCTPPRMGRTSPAQSEMKSLQDRVSVQYNAQMALVVTMKNLQIQDSGVYWCALDSGHTRKMEVKLSVFKRTQKLTAEKSANITVKCHYKIADYSTVSKAWCKREEGKTCKVLVTTTSESPAANSTAQERVRIQDDTQQGIVTVTMEQLQVQDSGVYWCALLDGSGLLRMEEITLNVSKALRQGRGSYSENQSQETLGDSENTFLILSVVLLILLLLALLSCTALAVRHYRLLLRTGNREAEDTSDRAEGTAQPGSSGRRESSQDGSKGPAYINLDVQSPSSPEDPLYCNVEPSQAPRNPQHVEYAIIAFNQAPRTSKE
ncbi:polymeric immunoglobulin receptor-like isoform X3 [Zonotrichia leucophrys gambelii]